MLSGSRLLPTLRYRTNEGWQVLGGCRWLPVMRSSGLMYGLVRRPYERNRNFAVFYQDAIPFFLSWAQFSGSCFHVKSLMGGLVFELDIISLVYGGVFNTSLGALGSLTLSKEKLCIRTDAVQYRDVLRWRLGAPAHMPAQSDYPSCCRSTGGHGPFSDR